MRSGVALLGTVGFLLWPAAAWASPIDYTKVSDNQLLLSMGVSGVILIAIMVIGVIGFLRYRRKRLETGKGPNPYILLAFVVITAVFWVSVFIYYCRHEGAEFIG